MLNTSHLIDARNGAEELNKLLKEFTQVQTMKKDLEAQLKPIEAKFKELQEAIMKKSVKGLNETMQFTWEFQINADSESVSIKKVKEDAPLLYDELKKANLIGVRHGAKSIKNVTRK